MVKKIATGIYQLSGVWGTGVWGANVFLLVDNNLTLVDTGYKGRARHILKEVRRLDYYPSEISNIIITHHHVDHVGGLAELKRACQAKVFAHHADAPYIDGRLPQPGPPTLNWASKMVTPLRGLWTSAPVSVDVLVDEGDELPILGGVRVLHTPGHTPGSISLLVKNEGVIIIGDVLNHRFGLRLPSKAFTVDMAQDINSAKKLTRLDFDIVCFGHGSPLLTKARPAMASFIDRLESKKQRSS